MGMDKDKLEIAEITDGDEVVGFHVMPTSMFDGTNAPWTGNSYTSTDSNTSVKVTFAPTEVVGHLVLDGEIQEELTTIPVGEREEQEEELTWTGVLAVEGKVTSDNRYLMPGKINHRELPLTLMVQNVTADGHDGAFAAGKITSIYKEERPDLGEGVIAIVGEGVFSDDEDGRKGYALLKEEVVRGVSIDFAPTATYLLDPETYEVLNEDEMDIMDLLSGTFVRGFEGDIMGATLCPFQAFEDATLQIVETGEKVIVASAFPMREVLTASAAGIAPLAPPYEWFYEPEHDGPCPLTVTPEGRVFGHLALWNQCHRASVLSGGCEMAPKSRSGYAFFNTGALTTEDGRVVHVGRITVGEGGHAPTVSHLGMMGAIEHYDKTGTIGAFVRAIDGRYGIWLSGAVRSDCPAEKVRDMQANPPSGDWRSENGRLELCAALSVPVGGFPVPRYEAALVASAAGDEEIVALVASGYSAPGEFTRSDQRKMERLKAEARKILGIESE